MNEQDVRPGAVLNLIKGRHHKESNSVLVLSRSANRVRLRALARRRKLQSPFYMQIEEVLAKAEVRKR